MSKVGDIIKNLLTKNVGNVAEGVVNTGLSLIRDKIRDSDTSFIREKVKKGVSISSKRVLNLTGTAAIITTALSLMTSDGLNKFNLLLLGLGIVYSAAMAFITAYSEKK